MQVLSSHKLWDTLQVIKSENKFPFQEFSNAVYSFCPKQTNVLFFQDVKWSYI